MATLSDVLAQNRDFDKTVVPSLLVAVSGAGVPQAISVDGSGSLVTATSEVAVNVLHSVYNVYSSTNVTTAAWVQLVASTSAAAKRLKIADTSGQVLEIGTGTAGNEVHLCYIPRGGIDNDISLSIAAGTRISVKAVSATANSGELIMEVIG